MMDQRSRAFRKFQAMVMLSVAALSAACSSEGPASVEAFGAPAGVDARAGRVPGTLSELGKRVVDKAVIAKINAFAAQLREEAAAGDERPPARSFFFDPDGAITDEFEPILTTRPDRNNQVGETSNWSGRTLHSRRNAPSPHANSQLAAFVKKDLVFNQNTEEFELVDRQQQIKFVGQDQHVYEFYRTFGHEGWIWNDLTEATSAPLARGPLAAFQTTFNNQQHVVYIGAVTLAGVTTDHVHELYFDGTDWHHTDLTLLTSSPAVAPNARNLTGYETSFNNQQHINFISADGHVRELWYDTSWHSNDLTAAAQALNPATPNALAFSSLNGYQTTFNNQQHVNFISANGHVNELWHGNQWQWNDLTLRAREVGTPAPDALLDSALSGYQTTFNNQQHVNYISGNGRLNELWYGNQWQWNDLTGTAAAPLANPSTPLTGYQTTYNDEQHVAYVDNNGHVVELFYDNNWQPNDLSVAGGFDMVDAGLVALAGYQTIEATNQQHVVFISTNNAGTAESHVRELFHDGDWNGADLTVLAHVPWVSATGTWEVPQVGIPLQNASSVAPDRSLIDDGWDSTTWVGIDGDRSSPIRNDDVLQAGTSQTIYEDGDTEYHAWYEWFVEGYEPIDLIRWRYLAMVDIDSMPISPGDTFLANIAYAGESGFIFLANLSRGAIFTAVLEPPLDAAFGGASIEWIHETPTANLLFEEDRLTALPSFTPVEFTSASGENLEGDVGDPTDPPPSGKTQDIDRALLFGRHQLTKTTVDTREVTIEFVDWYDTNLSAVFSAPPARPDTLVAFRTTFNNQQHVVYIGQNDNHVHELFYPNAQGRWQHTDLTATTPGVPNAAPGSRLSGYQTTYSNTLQQHINFISGIDNHLLELWYDSSWHVNDLTARAREIVGATPVPLVTSPLVGYETTYNSQQHVIFISAGGIVNEIFHADRWRPNDLIARAREVDATTPAALATSALAAYVTPNNQQHVIYIAPGGTVRELFFSDRWRPNDLTARARELTPGAPAANAASPLSGYVTTFNNQQHVNFVAPNGNVCELFFDTRWRFNNLSAIAGIAGTPASTTAGLNGYQTSFNGQQHVNFVSTGDNQLRELFFANNTWSARNLTSVPQNPRALAAAGTSRLMGYETFTTVQPPQGPAIIQNQQHHVFYVAGVDGSVHELIHGR
jgi:hypothetical protein